MGPQVLWAHNDSRGGANVYAINTDGVLVSSWNLEGVIALDWEDIAAGPGPVAGVNYLYQVAGLPMARRDRSIESNWPKRKASSR